MLKKLLFMSVLSINLVAFGAEEVQRDTIKANTNQVPIIVDICGDRYGIPTPP